MEKMKEHELWWIRKKGGGLVRGVEWKAKKMNTHKRVWLSEAATAEGWKELVFHFCDGRN